MSASSSISFFFQQLCIGEPIYQGVCRGSKRCHREELVASHTAELNPMLPHNCGRCNDMVVSANEAGEQHLANTIDIHLRNPPNIKQ